MTCPVMLQAICNSLWSYSKLGYNPGHRVLDIAARRAAVMLHQYTSQEIANTLWAFATLEQNPGAGMLDAAAMQISRRIEQFSPQVGLASVGSFSYMALKHTWIPMDPSCSLCN